MCTTGHPEIDRTDPAQVAAATDPGPDQLDYRGSGKVLYNLRHCKSCRSSISVDPDVVARIGDHGGER